MFILHVICWLAASASSLAPQNITLYGLRPYNLTGLDDKDTGNANGDMLFYFMGDLMMPIQCRANPSYYMCDTGAGSGKLLKQDRVYTKYNVEVKQGFTTYASCNPNLSVVPWGSKWSCTTLGKPTTSILPGKTGMAHNCGKFSDHDSPFYLNWTCQISTLLQFNGNETTGDEEIWYSTPGAGNCDSKDVPAENCSWRIVETVKVVNASCVHGNLKATVTAKNPDCFSACPAVEDIPMEESDCYLQCFMNVVLPNKTVGSKGMTSDEVMQPWLAGFESEDPSQMGCPALPIALPTKPPPTQAR
jgi:hypothetical protein